MTALHLGLVRDEESGIGPRVELVTVDLRSGAAAHTGVPEAQSEWSRSDARRWDIRPPASRTRSCSTSPDLTPGQTIYPTELRARAERESLALLERASLRTVGRGAQSRAQREEVPRARRCGSEGGRARQSARDAVRAAVLDAHLAGREWIAEDKLTLADLAISTPLAKANAASAQLPIAPYSNIQKWLGRVQDLPAWKKSGM